MSFTCVDISLFDELEDLGDADELLEALVQSVGYVSKTPAKTNLSKYVTCLSNMGFIFFFPNCILKIRVHLLKTNKFLYCFFIYFLRGFNQRFLEKCKQFKHFGSDLYRTLLFLTWTLALSSQRGTHMAGEKSVALDQVLSFQWIGQSFQMFLNLYSSNKFNSNLIFLRTASSINFYPFSLYLLSQMVMWPWTHWRSVQCPHQHQWSPTHQCSTQVCQTPPQNK